MHRVTMAAPAMHIEFGIWCMTIIWNRKARIISKALSTETDVGDTIFKAAVIAKMAKIPIKEIIDRIAQSKTSNFSIVVRILLEWQSNIHAIIEITIPPRPAKKTRTVERIRLH